MPIKVTDENNNEVAWLSDEVWDLPEQMKSFDNWLSKDGHKLKKGNYVADLGFSPREGAAGGGYVVSKESMKIMLVIGMELYLSEYSAFENEKP